MTDHQNSSADSEDDFQALREVEEAWLASELGRAISNLAYPVGCGAAPTDYHLKAAARALFDRYAKMVKMARGVSDAAQPAPEPVKDDLPLTEVVAKLRAIVADHGGLMHEIEPVDAILCPDCGANLAAEHHKSGWCPSVGVLPRSSADNGDTLTQSCRAHVSETALREIRRYCETMDPSRSETIIAQVKRTADAALALSSDLPQTAVWQPIDTAPKDGPNILVCRAHEARSVCEAFWWEGAWRCWDGENHTRSSFILDYLTHWQPMPAPASYALTRPHGGGAE